MHSRQKKKEGKRNKKRIVYCFLCNVRYDALRFPVYSQLTVFYVVRGRKMQSPKKKKEKNQCSLARIWDMVPSPYQSTDNVIGRRKASITASVACPFRVRVLENDFQFLDAPINQRWTETEPLYSDTVLVTSWALFRSQYRRAHRTAIA